MVQIPVRGQSGYGRMVIEMNPRFPSSPGLRATDFPIAKIAAKLAVGDTLMKSLRYYQNTPASFEPTIDYCVVKPRFAFEKFLWQTLLDYSDEVRR